ncbi:MAG TPA: flagellar motor switch protein FliN, partial [Actinobacteria bacterium]|nr:flagellar motor switch protein FliN [Actinomycetota bacterium]
TETLGITAQVTAVSVVDAIDDPALESGTAARTVFTGGPAPASIVTVLAGEGFVNAEGASVDSSVVCDVFAAGVAEPLSVMVGAQLTAEPAQPLPMSPDVAGLGTYIVRADFAGEPSGSLTAHWVVEASLAAMLDDGAPVAPGSSDVPSVAPATLPNLDGPGRAGAAIGRDLEILADVPMNVTVELGRTTMQVRDLLALQEGSIIELDRVADSAVDVLVNGTLVAHGDVVVVDDELGIRITDVVARG